MVHPKSLSVQFSSVAQGHYYLAVEVGGEEKVAGIL